MRSSLPATEYDRRGEFSFGSALPQHRKCIVKGFAINDEMLKIPDCGITSMNLLKQISEKRASEARFYRKV